LLFAPLAASRISTTERCEAFSTLGRAVLIHLFSLHCSNHTAPQKRSTVESQHYTIYVADHRFSFGDNTTIVTMKLTLSIACYTLCAMAPLLSIGVEGTPDNYNKFLLEEEESDFWERYLTMGYGGSFSMSMSLPSMPDVDEPSPPPPVNLPDSPSVDEPPPPVNLPDSPSVDEPPPPVNLPEPPSGSLPAQTAPPVPEPEPPVNLPEPEPPVNLPEPEPEPPVNLPATIVDIAVNSPVHTTLVAGVTAAGLVDALSAEGPLTLFAPVDDAFTSPEAQQLLERLLLPDYEPHLIDLLTYHVLSGQVLSSDLSVGLSPAMLNGETTEVTSLTPPMINQATIEAADLEAGNGVVHVIDQVLLPASATNSIVDLAAANPSFTTLVELVIAAGLAETLSTTGPYTVFAPTNEAFAALPADLLESLKEPENSETLLSILTYHVASGVVTAGRLTEGMTVSMLNGESSSPITLSPPMIGTANIVTTDILANNGYVPKPTTISLPARLLCTHFSLTQTLYLLALCFCVPQSYPCD
jgi:transforming growth factor-beta-induced protein